MSNEYTRFYEKVQDAVKDDLVALDDGFYTYWPEGQHKGALSAMALRVIADVLDEKNKDHERELELFFREGEVDG